jgi:hypothetical protein
MPPNLKDFAYSFNELDIKLEHVEEAMGYAIGQTPDPFPAMISEALEQGSELCNIKGSLLVSHNFTLDKQGIMEVNGVTFLIGKKIAQQLKNADGAALFICTAGVGISEKSKELMAAGNFIEGYIFDVIGSVTVEAAIDKIQENFENDLNILGKKMANRYSPGYCGWALNEQKSFFALFPKGHCGIRLSDSCLMDPIKSVSGVMGFGTNVKKTANECLMCELKTCVYRAIRLAREK